MYIAWIWEIDMALYQILHMKNTTITATKTHNKTWGPTRKIMKKQGVLSHWVN